MCGFLSAFSKDKKILDYIENNVDELMRLIKKRGPSETKNTRDEEYFISHSLLAINDHVVQPVIKDNLVVFMNGEIYNKEAIASKNDTEWILKFFEEKRSESELDGEFIIHVLDKKEETLTILSDPFATKPCYYFHGNKTLVTASYQEPLFDLFKNQKIVEFPPNTLIKFCTKDMKILEVREVITWDFKTKYKDFDRWDNSFKNSITKRTETDKQIFLGLSSGYDSGLIVSELLNLKKICTSYSIYGAEEKETLDKRIDLVNKSSFGSAKIVSYDQKRYDRHLAFIKNNCSNYPYRDVNGRFIKWMLDDKAAVGLSMICEDASNINSPIYFSGQGADEIFSDYSSRGPHHGTIRGNFTNVRKKWVNFDQGFQRNFLSKEERIPGAWGIEARYPFLDRYVVQEFLWLDDSLKNSEYKQCLSQRLRAQNFPFRENEKCGFNPLKSLPSGKKIYK